MTSKKTMKRKAAQSINHLVNAANTIIELREIFKTAHPRYADFFDFAVTTVCLLIEQLKTVYARAWGYFPEDISQWLH